MTRFDVRRDGRVMACTEHKECIPPRERRDELRKAGYRLFLDGKIWKENKNEYIQEGRDQS